MGHSLVRAVQNGASVLNPGAATLPATFQNSLPVFQFQPHAGFSLATIPLASWAKTFQIFKPILFAANSATVATTAPASKNTLVLKGATAVERILETVRFIDKRLKTSVYNHKTKIDIAKGQFEFDCSGMVNWILQQAAPTAYAELNSERPRVAEYVKALKAIPYDKPSAGWRRVKKIEDAEPGDVIAWPTPDWYPSDATGHMGVVAEKPEKVSGGYLIRFADSTSLPHGEDSREDGTSTGTGFGYGTLLITVDADTGIGTGQGWTGRYSANTVIKTPIYIGRPLK